jgi:uncharacterized protein YjbI with pentapeptide repeats
LNEEHLAQLKKGAENWNLWRQNHEVQLDLNNLDLHEPPLFEADFFEADFFEADLSGINLSGANLSGANLSKAFLDGANFHEACLAEADLSGADLTGANLREAFLNGANFTGANLNRADLWKAFLSSANLSSANLSSANLSGADLQRAQLNGADLSRADLVETVLIEANLIEANLRSADLSNACLWGANLSKVFLKTSQLLGSNLTSTILTGACIQDWNINNATRLNNITCEYFYWKGEQQYREQKFLLSDRRPSDPNSIFAPGEFAKLFQKALETVDLIFVDGIDWKAFFQSFQELRSQYDDETLSIQAIEKKSGGAFVIRLEVLLGADKGRIERLSKELYERDRLLLETQYQYKLQAKDEQITIYQEWLNSERQRSTDLTGIVKTMADKETEKVTQHFHAPVTAVAGNVEGDQNIYTSPEKQSLAEAAAEI